MKTNPIQGHAEGAQLPVALLPGTAGQPPLQLTITGTEEELRHYLDATRLSSVLWELDQQCRGKINHGHTFSSVEEALAWVRDEIGEATNER